MIQELINQKEKFSVCSHVIRIGGLKHTTYFLLALNSEKFLEKGFYPSDTFDYCSEFDMSTSDVNNFKKNIGMFTKVVNNNDGTIYELKDNSFKDYASTIYKTKKQDSYKYATYKELCDSMGDKIGFKFEKVK